MSTDIVPVEDTPIEAEPEVEHPTEAERDSLETPPTLMRPTKEGSTILNSTMVSGSDHEPKSSVDYVTSGFNEIKQILKQILDTTQQQQQPQAKLSSIVSTLNEKVQQLSEDYAAASQKEKENRNTIAELQTENENLKKRLEGEMAEIQKRHDNDLKKLNEKFEEKIYQQEVEKYKQENVNYKQEIEKHKNELQKCKEEATVYKTKYTHSELVAKQRDEDNKRYQDEQQGYLKQIDGLKDENRALKSNNEELKTKLNEEELRKTIDDLEQKLHNKEAENAKLNCDLASLRSLNEGKQQIIDIQKRHVDHHMNLQMHAATNAIKQFEIKEETDSTTVTYKYTKIPTPHD